MSDGIDTRRGDATQRLAQRLSDAVGTAVELARPSEAAHGDFATNAALRLAPTRGVSPREIAVELAAAAETLPEVERAEVAGPGFVNLTLGASWFGEALGEILDAGEDYGGGSAETRERV